MSVKPRSILTLWFSSNTAVAKYAIGLIPATLGLSPTLTIISLTLGNFLASIILGIATSMGPRFNKEQIRISQDVFNNGWKVFSFLNFLNTLGWFIVNVTLGGFALSVLTNNVVLGGLIIVVIDVSVVIFGSSFIHKFESYVSLLLVALGIFISAEILTVHMKIPEGGSFSSFWIVFLTSFGAILSWSPYASDYSKGLNLDFKKSLFYTSLGATVPSVWLSYLGYLSALAIGKSSPIADVLGVLGKYFLAGVVIMVLGIVSADALNLYTNTVALTSIVNIKREIATIIAGVLGFIAFYFIYKNFLDFLINFLSSLGYWISPWIGVLIAYLIERKDWKRAWVSFSLSVIIALPFMNLRQYGIPYEGFISSMMGGIDVSQIVMFFVSILFYLML
jgi:NCS1 family nucleobase:cation symporter-1